MDQGPFRMARPADRSASGRPTATSRPEEKPVIEEPKPTHRASSAHHTKDNKPKKRLITTVVGVVILLLAVFGGWALWSNVSGGDLGIDKSKYQAVFFTNGQVYFGKLHSFNNDYMKLTDIFYLQSQQDTETTDKKNPQETQTDDGSNNLTLVKLGDEIHGPQDEMIISKDQMLFFENLKPDSKVTSVINDYNDKH